MLKQKSRAEWLKSGDTNSKFYHSMLRWMRARNDLVEICINGTWCEDPQHVKSHIKRYFETRF